MPHPALAVFTGNSLDEILAVGGSKSWVLNEKHAKRQRYLVCIRNAQAADFSSHEPHGAAFGLVKDLRHDGFDAKGLKRWTVEISEYAPVLHEGAWGEWRNPVKYTTLEELGIDAKQLKFQPMPAPTVAGTAPLSPAVRPLSIAEAKQGLALKFGVPPEAIDIVIKG